MMVNSIDWQTSVDFSDPELRRRALELMCATPKYILIYNKWVGDAVVVIDNANGEKEIHTGNPYRFIFSIGNDFDAKVEGCCKVAIHYISKFIDQRN